MAKRKSSTATAVKKKAGENKSSARKSVGKPPALPPSMSKPIARAVKIEHALPSDAHQSVEHRLGQERESIVVAQSRGEWLEPFRGQSHKPKSRHESGSHSGPFVSAWHGSFGTSVSAVTAALMSGTSLKRAEELQAEVIIGPDDRVRVNSTKNYPYLCLCHLEIEAITGRMYVGTGWLIEPSTVVTAGHCLWLHKEGGWAKSIRVFPGRNGQDIFKSREAARMLSVNGWIRDRDPVVDYGVIKLDSPLDDIGTIGFQTMDDADLMAYKCHIIGYPADKRGEMWGHGLGLKAVNDQTLIYEMDTYGGNSGGPVMIFEDGGVLGVGIHNYGDLRGNSATRITSEVYDNLTMWSKA